MTHGNGKAKDIFARYEILNISETDIELQHSFAQMYPRRCIMVLVKAISESENGVQWNIAQCT